MYVRYLNLVYYLIPNKLSLHTGNIYVKECIYMSIVSTRHPDSNCFDHIVEVVAGIKQTSTSFGT